jgi:hypothetical protein
MNFEGCIPSALFDSLIRRSVRRVAGARPADLRIEDQEFAGLRRCAVTQAGASRVSRSCFVSPRAL